VQHLMQRHMEGHIVNILKDTYRHTDRHTDTQPHMCCPWPSGCMVTLAYCCCHPQHRQTDGLYCQHRDHDVCSSNNIKIIITTVTRNTDCLLSIVKYTGNDNCTGPVIINKNDEVTWPGVQQYIRSAAGLNVPLSEDVIGCADDESLSQLIAGSIDSDCRHDDCAGRHGYGCHDNKTSFTPLSTHLGIGQPLNLFRSFTTLVSILFR